MVDQAEIHGMVWSEDVEERRGVAEQFRDSFADLPDKKQAWHDLHRLTSDNDSGVRERATYALERAFSNVSDKIQVGEDLHRLSSDTDAFVRYRVAHAFMSTFSHVPDKKQVCEDLHRLSSDTDSNVRLVTAYALGNAFSYVPDNKKACEDLHRLTSDNDSFVRRAAAESLGNAFSYVPDKKQAWEDLYRLTSDTDSEVRRRAAESLGNVFSHVPDKKQAWKDLYGLTSDTDTSVRWRVAESLWNAFLHVPDKKQAWEDLHMLTFATDSNVRKAAAESLGDTFSHMPDKKQAWDDLHRLTSDTDASVRWRAAYALGNTFSHVPDKKQAWEDLIRLTSDNESHLRASAYHSLGKASIFKAANAENDIDIKKEMETAIGYFEQSSEQDTYSKPAKFCLPFYCSFYTLTFKKEETEAEVLKYLKEAKSAVEGSESKEKLLEAVENLGNALKEAQKARDFSDVKADLNAYRRYCDRACELLDTTEEKAPGASRMIRKGLPIINDRIKGIIAEIQEKAKALCKETKDTPLEELGKKVNKEGQNLLKVDNPIALDKAMDTMHILLSSICAKMPEEEKGEACELLKLAKDEQIVEEKIKLINIILGKFSSQRSIVKILENFDKKLSEMIVSLKPRIREEITITVGAEFHGTGSQHVITIPLQEISYSELKEDLEKISDKGLIKLATLPLRLTKKIKDYLIKNKKDELLEVI